MAKELFTGIFMSYLTEDRVYTSMNQTQYTYDYYIIHTILQLVIERFTPKNEPRVFEAYHEKRFIPRDSI